MRPAVQGGLQELEGAVPFPEWLTPLQSLVQLQELRVDSSDVDLMTHALLR